MSDVAIIETPEDNWAKHREAAALWVRKAPENPWCTIADAHVDYFMRWLDRHQFHPWGWNVRALYEMWASAPDNEFSSAFSLAFDAEAMQ